MAVMDYRTSKEEIRDGLRRNSYGGGERTEKLEIQVEDNKREQVDVEVSERMYEESELDSMFEACVVRIEKEMLGENESLDYVTKDLNLMKTLQGEPVEIEWSLNHYEVLNIYGEIRSEELTEKGKEVLLEATITYTENPERQTQYQCMAMVYPEKLSGKEQMIAKIQEEIKKRDANLRTKKTLELPDNVDGKKIYYYRQTDNRGWIIILIAILAGILFYIQEIQNQGQEIKKRQQQMMEDYPEIVNKMALFLGAGMNVKRSWRKIVEDYEAEKDTWGMRYAYEEMKITCREMESGRTEAESYERFGRRCHGQEYIRFGALLSQNIRKGTKGLTQILKMEAVQAFENRKMRAKKLGEEAGTKLLIPMFIMFTVVLIMVIVPAFLSMQI